MTDMINLKAVHNRKCRKIEYNGVVYKSLAALSRIMGIAESTLRARIKKYDYTVKNAVELPIHSHCKLKRIRPVVEKIDAEETLRQYNKLNSQHHLIPNTHSRRGMYG